MVLLSASCINDFVIYNLRTFMVNTLCIWSKNISSYLSNNL